MPKVLSVFLAVLILMGSFSFIPVAALPGETTPLVIDSMASDNGAIAEGQKGVDFSLTYIDLHIGGSFSPASDAALNNIRLYANGMIDETYKFDITYSIFGTLELSIKASFTKAGNLPYQLIKHALYSIVIPQGVFLTSDAIPNQERVINFVTSTDEGIYRDDLLSASSPVDGSAGVSDSAASIVFEFIDDIAMDDNVKDNIGDYLQITSEPFNPAIPSYTRSDTDTGSDSIENYDVGIEGKKLVLTAREGKLKDYAHYTVTLKKNSIYLRKAGLKIFNLGTGADGSQTVQFDTDNMLSRTSPVQNEENVSVEPTITFTFKYPVRANAGSISFSSDAGSFSVDVDRDVRLSRDGRTLSINIDDLRGNMIYPLRRNTLYKITLPQGMFKFEDYADTRFDPPLTIVNREIDLYFITRGEGEAPTAIAFSSDAAATDDIRLLSETRLDANGSIYVHFDRPVQKDIKSFQPYIFKIFKIPTALSTGYDYLGRRYDRELDFYQSVSGSVYRIMPSYVPEPGLNRDDLENEALLEEVPIESADIYNSDTIKIHPYTLNSLTKYKIIIDNAIIEDVNGYNPDKDIQFTFWTRASDTAQVPEWEGLNGVSAMEPYDPASPDSPHLIANISTEVIPAAADEDIPAAGTLTGKRITFDSLKAITLIESGNSSAVGISRFRLEYFFENGVKKTKLHLYPGSRLESGKQYSLGIPAGTLESRSGSYLGSLEANFTIEGDRNGQRGIYSLTGSNLKTLDFASAGQGSFVIKGYNFIEAVDRIELVPVSDNIILMPSITIPREDVSFENVNSLKVKLRGAAAQELAKEPRAGTYRVELYFADRPAQAVASPVNLVLSGRGKPSAAEYYPYSAIAGVRFDENSLNPKNIDGTIRYFLQVTFEDPDGSLEFNGTGLQVLRDNTTVYAQGAGSNMVDTAFLRQLQEETDLQKQQNYISLYIFKKDTIQKKAYLYIPVILLKPQTTYNVSIGSEAVIYSGMVPSEGGNASVAWSFTTMGIPTVDGISTGSLSEDYDEDIPLILAGEQFYEASVKVSFNNVEAARVNVKTGPGGAGYLEVYLPKGTSRLKPGVYNIVVMNDGQHMQTVFGYLSIVKGGERLPDEKYRVKDAGKKGDIYSSLEVSEDTIELNAGYNDNSLVRLDLDKLMGPEVLVRKIKIRGSRNNSIGTLDTRSGYCDISIYGLTLGNESGSTIEVELGRVQPQAAQALKSQLKGRPLKSELIQIGGSNYRMTGAALSVPYKNSSGENLRVLRYDEPSGSWEDEDFTVDRVEGRVTIETNKPGVFIVLE